MRNAEAVSFFQDSKWTHQLFFTKFPNKKNIDGIIEAGLENFCFLKANSLAKEKCQGCL